MKPTFIYFADCIGPGGAPIGAVKIGCSSDVKRRAERLSAGQPYDCKVLAYCPGSFLAEAVLHEWLRSDRISGEFFRDTAEVRRLVSSTRETEAVPFHIDGAEPRLHEIGRAGAHQFMAVHLLTVPEAARLTGRARVFFDAGLAQTTPPRGFIAALAVAALRAGRTVDWDFDFLPSSVEAAA